MYHINQKTKSDNLFKIISKMNLDDRRKLLLSNQFVFVKGGKYTQNICHDGNHLIKFFDVNHYGKNPIFKDYLDYHVYDYINKDEFNIFPQLYGYKDRDFMVVEYAGETTLWKTSNFSFSEEIILKFVTDYFDCQKKLYQLSGFYIDDLAGKNIVFNEKTNEFKMVDLSCVSAFSSGYFAREYLVWKIEKLMETFYRRGWIKHNTLLETKKKLIEKYQEGYFWE